MTAVQYPNWFQVTAADNFARFLSPLAGTPGLRFLQVGVFTGDATMWLVENVLTGSDSRLVDVDTWKGSDEPEHRGFDWSDVEATYLNRTAAARKVSRVVPRKQLSRVFFTAIATYDFDFIYVDGAHDSFTVLNDAVDAFRVLKPGGLLAFDDYNWDTVAAGVDGFAGCCGPERLEPLEIGVQAWFRRVA
jgi:SAM-dependent methyltransferase